MRSYCRPFVLVGGGADGVAAAACSCDCNPGAALRVRPLWGRLLLQLLCPVRRRCILHTID